MDNAFALLAAAITWWAFFHAIRLGALDPHNLADFPGRWATLAQSALALLALLMFTGAQKAAPDHAPFFAMFVLSQVVAPAFTGKDRMRNDEVPNAFVRWLEGVKSGVAGSVLMTLVSLILAATTSWLIGSWWFALLLLLGFMLMKSKAAIAVLMAHGEEGTLARLPPQERAAKLRLLYATCLFGQIGYLLGAVCVGFILFREAGLQPKNWSGWIGIAFGAVFGPIVQWVRFR